MYGAGRIGYAAELNVASALVLNKFQNKSLLLRHRRAGKPWSAQRDPSLERSGDAGGDWFWR